jgi:hypothetical protein
MKRRHRLALHVAGASVALTGAGCASPRPAPATVGRHAAATATSATTTSTTRATGTTTPPRTGASRIVSEGVASPGQATGPTPSDSTPRWQGVLACIRSFEQGGAGYATETANGYSGAYQFTPSTWAGAVTGPATRSTQGDRHPPRRPTCRTRRRPSSTPRRACRRGPRRRGSARWACSSARDCRMQPASDQAQVTR